MVLFRNEGSPPVFRARPPLVAMVCVGLWLMQLVLTVWLLFYRRSWPGWQGNDAAAPWWEMTVVSISIVLGMLLVWQLPRALQWRPRRSVRPSAEVAAERQRIARDLHDNLGSQLVSAMTLLSTRPTPDHEVRTILEQCMLDIRLVVDSMDGAGEPFIDRLARVRHRMRPVLEQRGIAMVWDIDVPDGVNPLHPQGTAQLIAIVQESLSNVLQHSQASEVVVTVRYAPEAQSWSLQIRDNGSGVRASTPPETSAMASALGSGIRGMHHRARSVGGLLRVEPVPGGGICVWVLVPSNRAD